MSQSISDIVEQIIDRLNLLTQELMRPALLFDMSDAPPPQKAFISEMLMAAGRAVVDLGTISKRLQAAQNASGSIDTSSSTVPSQPAHPSNGQTSPGSPSADHLPPPTPSTSKSPNLGTPSEKDTPGLSEEEALRAKLQRLRAKTPAAAPASSADLPPTTDTAETLSHSQANDFLSALQDELTTPSSPSVDQHGPSPDGFTPFPSYSNGYEMEEGYEEMDVVLEAERQYEPWKRSTPCNLDKNCKLPACPFWHSSAASTRLAGWYDRTALLTQACVAASNCRNYDCLNWHPSPSSRYMAAQACGQPPISWFFPSYA